MSKWTLIDRYIFSGCRRKLPLKEDRSTPLTPSLEPMQMHTLSAIHSKPNSPVLRLLQHVVYCTISLIPVAGPTPTLSPRLRINPHELVKKVKVNMDTEIAFSGSGPGTTHCVSFRHCSG
jgi:hypothetical protein